MSQLMERMDRWASALPSSDSIPVTENETFELAFYVNAQSPMPSSYMLEIILKRLKNGKMVYRDHPVEVL